MTDDTESTDGESTEIGSGDESTSGDTPVDEETTGMLENGTDSGTDGEKDTVAANGGKTDSKNSSDKDDEGGFSWLVFGVVSVLIAIIAVVAVLVYKGKIVLYKKKEDEIN